MPATTVGQSPSVFVCLAAGRGERMQPLTNYLHKAMIPFAGAPFLSYAFLSIPNNATVIMVVNHLSTQMKHYFGDSYLGKEIRYLTQSNPMGTGDALFQFARAFRPKDQIIVWHADQFLYPEDLNTIVQNIPNTVLFSDGLTGQQKIGLWKISPSTLERMRDRFVDGEYRALPVMEQEGVTLVRSSKRKTEVSFNNWSEIERVCNAFKQKFITEFH